MRSQVGNPHAITDSLRSEEDGVVDPHSRARDHLAARNDRVRRQCAHEHNQVAVVRCIIGDIRIAIDLRREHDVEDRADQRIENDRVHRRVDKGCRQRQLEFALGVAKRASDTSSVGIDAGNAAKADAANAREPQLDPTVRRLLHVSQRRIDGIVHRQVPITWRTLVKPPRQFDPVRMHVIPFGHRVHMVILDLQAAEARHNL